MRFEVKINLGNDAVRDEWDVCAALRALPIKPGAIRRNDSGKIFDANGNTVGEWAFVPEQPGIARNPPLPDSKLGMRKREDGGNKPWHTTTSAITGI